MSKVIRIGAATAFFNDSRMGIAQLLAKAGPLDYIIFDFLAESVMGGAEGVTRRRSRCRRV